MEKVTKKREKLNLAKIKNDQIFSVDRNTEYYLTLDFSELNTDLDLNLKFNHIKDNVSSYIKVRALGNSDKNVKINIISVAPNKVKNISSELSIIGILLNNKSSLTVVPSLEINENNVSVDHKSSIGAPSIDYINYLASKGLSKEQSIELITMNFLD